MKKIGSLALDFLKDGIVFFILGFALMFPMEMIGGIYAKEAEAIFFESLAPRTIMALFVLSTLFASLAVLIFGKHNSNEKINDVAFRYGIFKITSFSMSFSSAGTGMLIGLSVAAVTNEEFDVALKVFFTSLVFVAYWCYFECLNYVCKNGFGGSISKKLGKVFLFIAIVAAPALYAFSYEPVKECQASEESTNKQLQPTAEASAE